MPGTRTEEIFQELKKFLCHGRTWQKVLVSQHDLLKVFVPLLQLHNSFRTPDIEQKKIPESLSFFKLCLKIVFNNTEAILN